MPFKLKISSVEYQDAEIAISGRLVEGAYAGPEAVIIHGQDRTSITTPVTQHSLYLPENWPVLPSHDTILTLSIDAPSSSFRVDESQPVIGLGTVFENSNRIDISHVLSDGVFLAMQLSLSLESEDVEDPNETYFGISTDEINNYYRELIHSKFDAGVWPYIRLPLDEARYVELEFAASIEYQDRFWIGDSRVPHRVLLGYNSGHFSLPAFSFEEILWFHGVLDSSPANRAATTLLMTACYLQDPGRAGELTTELFSQLPGVKPGVAASMAKEFLEKLTVPELCWEQNSRLWWINNSIYSQRNPKSTMSLLDHEDFDFIEKFFDRQ
jgi:hypothetical protein